MPESLSSHSGVTSLFLPRTMLTISVVGASLDTCRWDGDIVATESILQRSQEAEEYDENWTAPDTRVIGPYYKRSANLLPAVP